MKSWRTCYLWMCSDPVLRGSVLRLVRPARSSAFWRVCLWSSSRAGRSWHSHGGRLLSCCVWCCSSSPSACCPGSTTSLTSVASCRVSFCRSLSCPTSASAAWTCTASVARSSSHSHSSWASSPGSWCSSMSIPSSASGASCSPAFP